MSQLSSGFIQFPIMHRDDKVKEGYSPLFNILSRYLFEAPNITKEMLDGKVISQPLVLSLVEFRGTSFVSDLKHTIQLILPTPNLDQIQMKIATNPFSFLQTTTYKKIDKERYNFWQPYNCSNKELLLAESVQNLHPYTPQYFMGDEYYEFKVKKPLLNEIALQSRTIRLSQWKIKIVNVSKTGWYAPALEAVHHKIENPSSKLRENYKNVNLVLYEPQIKELMENMRLEDMRRLKKYSFEGSPLVSLVYYLNAKPKSNTITHMVRVDKKQEIFKFDEKKKLSYVSINEIEGSVILTEKIDLPPLNTRKVKEQQMKNWQILMSAPQSSKPKPTNGFNRAEQEMLDWSDSSFQQNQHQAPKKLLQVMLDEDQQLIESEEEEDVLKKLYSKQLNISTIRLF